jgi:hypothetical protein
MYLQKQLEKGDITEYRIEYICIPSTVVRNSRFLLKLNPILNTDSIRDRYRIFLTPRFESKTESEPNARNQNEPAFTLMKLAGYSLLILWISLTSNNLFGPKNWYSQD